MTFFEPLKPDRPEFDPVDEDAAKTQHLDVPLMPKSVQIMPRVVEPEHTPTASAQKLPLTERELPPYPKWWEFWKNPWRR